MHHLVANAPWEDATMLRIACDIVLTEMERHGPVAAWLVDDTAFPKKGQHSVGVAHQYCGTLGKQANCQVAVTVTLANEAVSVPAAYQLYLPEDWARDRKRRRAAKIPKTVLFRPRRRICPRVRWLPMRVTASPPSSGTRSPRAGLHISSACARTRRCGRLA
jgi:SRSO17 transposase